jgi:hypothetical protein
VGFYARGILQSQKGLISVILSLGILAVLLLRIGGYVWLRAKGGGEQIAIGGPFTLMNAAGKQVTDRDFRADTCWCTSAMPSVPTSVRPR